MAAKKYIYDCREWTEEEMRRLVKLRGKMASRAIATLQMVEGDVILDVGCGAGEFAYHIAPRVSKVVAIDTLETSIEIARDFFSLPNIDFVVGDLFQMKFPNYSFDCVLFLETIEHVENPTLYLKEFHRLLKPGGFLIISTPNALSYSSIVRNIFFYFSKMISLVVRNINKEQRDTGTNLDHIYAWDFTTLYRLLNRCGFTYVDHAFAGFWPVTVNLLRWWRLRFPFWTKKETKVMSLLKPFALNLVFKVQKI
ncbi:class I SAM-dependent methyltransferase [Chloroflexota bacterium]